MEAAKPGRQLKLAICRRADELPLNPTSIEGFYCANCGIALRVSPKCAKDIRDTEHTESPLRPLCNACGRAITELLNTTGLPVTVLGTPRAMQQLGAVPDHPASQFMFSHSPFCYHCGAHIAKPEEALSHQCKRPS